MHVKVWNILDKKLINISISRNTNFYTLLKRTSSDLIICARYQKFITVKILEHGSQFVLNVNILGP